MNLQRSQSVPLQPLRQAETMAGASAPLNSSSPVASERPVFRFDLARSLQLHRRMALGFALAGLLLAAAYVLKSWPVYIAQSQIYIQPAPPTVMGQGNDQRWPYDSNTYDSFIQQQVQNATNPAVLLYALQKLGTDSYMRPGETEDAAAARLGKAVQVARLGTSYEIAITAKAKNPELAAGIANAMAASLVERASHQQNAGDPQRLAILRDEQDRVQNQLNADLAEQEALNKQLGMAAVGSTSPDLIDSAIDTTRQELIKARTDHDEAEARFDAMNASQGASSAALQAEADEIISTDAGLTSMKTSLNQRRAVLISQMANLTPNNPEYKQDSAELAKINSSLDSMMKDLRAQAAARIQERLSTDLQRTAGVEAQLNGQLRQLAAAAAGATPKLQRENDLAADITRLRTRYATVDEELHNLMLQDSVPGAAHLSVAAVAPLHPALTGVAEKALPLILGGIFFGLIAALVANNLDPRIYIASDIEALLGFAPLATLPEASEVSEEVFDEHMLRLSAALEHARAQSGIRNCVFTGVEPEAGVTTVIAKVSGLLEAMGRPVMLAEGVGMPHPASRANADRAGQAEAGNRATAQPAGHSTALLQSAAGESEEQPEAMLFTDTAPLMISAETEYLARFADCVIVVLQSSVTTRQQLRAVADTLQRMDVPTVGFVLNRVGMAKADPAFRQTLRSMESRLRVQGRTTSRRPARSHHFEPEPVANPRPERPMTAPAAASIPEPVRKAAVPSTASPVPGLPPVPVAPAPLPQPEADNPWWLSETAVRPVVPPIAPPPVPQREPVPAVAAKAEPQPAMQEQEDVFQPSPRLRGLRDAHFSFSLSKLAQGAQPEEASFTPAASSSTSPLDRRSFEGKAEWPAKQKIFTPVAEPVPVAAAAVRHTEVTAAPEFLPPTPAPSLGKEFIWNGGPATRKDNREAFDDVQILPSWRGQYKRKD